MDISSSLGYPVGQGVSHQSSPSSGAPTPPDTPVSTPLSAYASPVAYPSPKAELPQLSQLKVPTSPYNSPYTSQPPSPFTDGVHTLEPLGLVRSETSSPTTSSGRPNLNLNLASFSQLPSVAPSTSDPLNVYARYDYSISMPVVKLEGENDAYNVKPSSVKMECVPPSLVFPDAESVTNTIPSPEQVKSTSPPQLRIPPVKPVLSIPTPASLVAASNPSSAAVSPSASTPPSPSSKASTSLARAHTASLLLSKPFRCPKPNCNKSYKQANGKFPL